MFTNIFKIAAGLIFVIALVTSMFALGSVGRIGFEKVMGVDNCYHVGTPTPVDGITGDRKIDYAYADNCKRDTANNNKRQVADALAMLLVAVPTTVFFYKRVRE